MGGDQAGQTKSIPIALQPSYKRLVNSNPKARLTVSNFLDQGLRSGGFFDTPLIKLTENVDSLSMKTEEERDEFLKYESPRTLLDLRLTNTSELDQLSDDFPEDYFKLKVLPELLKSVEFGGGGPKVLSVVMKISAKLAEDDFDSKVAPVIIRLFSSPDRALRVSLLDNLPLMIDRLSPKVVNDKIFPQMVSLSIVLNECMTKSHRSLALLMSRLLFGSRP